MSARLLGAVLCGGKSTRMGCDKAELRYRDRTFLQHAIRRLNALCDAVVLSGIPNARYDVPIIADDLSGAGPAAGVATVLRYARDEDYAACLFTPVDVPRLAAADLSSLVDEWRQAAVLTLACGDRAEPLIGVYPVTYAESLAQLAAGRDRSLRRWLNSQPHACVAIPSERLVNINTPQAYQQNAR